MPSFSVRYAPPGAYVKFLRENLSPDLTADYRIPVIIGAGEASKLAKKTLVRGGTTKDSISVTDVTAIVKIGNTENKADYVGGGVDYALGTGADAGKVIWTTPGQSTAGSYVVNNLENGTLSTAITASSGSGTLVNDSYVVEVTAIGAGSTKGSYVGQNAISSTLSVTETITVTIAGVTYSPALTSGMTKAQAIAAIQAAVGTSIALVTEATTKLSIVTVAAGATQTIVVTVVDNTLRTELGLGTPVYTAGTTGTGAYTITPRSSRVTTTYLASEVANTAIPGVSVLFTTTVGRTVGEKLEIVATAAQIAKNPLAGATYYIQVTSSKQEVDYELKYYTKEEEETFYTIFGEPSPSNSLSLGAYVAFRNQADIIGVVQLNGGTSLSHFQAAIDKLVDRPIYYIVPLTTNPEVHAYLKLHVDSQSETLNRRERIGLIGGAAGYSIFDHTDSAVALNDERMVIVAPSSWELKYLTSTNLEYTANVDGSYAAVAVAAAASRRDPAEPITRKQIVGLTPLVSYNPTQQNQLAEKGVMVLDTKGSVNRVRHQLTTNYNGPIESKELSIVQLRDHLSIILRNNLESEFIGIKIVAATPKIIESYAEKILEGLVQQEIIMSFDSVKATQSDISPDEILLDVACTPVYPLNYVTVRLKFIKQAQKLS